MSSWFDQEVSKRAEGLGDGVVEDLERQRDEFRREFQNRIKESVWPSFENFVVEATEHDFPATVGREEDAQGRLRAVVIRLLAISGAEASPLALETCSYKIALQMGTQRIAHMMNFQNRSNPRIRNEYDFQGLDSLDPENIEQKLKRFLHLSLEYCKGPPSI